MSLVDSYGRKINYLRLSITDRCNLRCRYCMPEEGVTKIKHQDILNYEELMMLAEAAVDLGIEKIRVTGGEPLVRTGVIDLLKNLSRIPKLRQLVLTTNGVLLEEMAESLKNAGVQRLNISLDSLRDSTFSEITRCGKLEKVLKGIKVADEMGFPLKINVVAMRGLNDEEFVDFAKLTLDKPYAVRFIEYMPTSKEADWQSMVISGEEIIKMISNQFPLEEAEKGQLTGPARNFRIKGAAGTVGIITPISGHFCGECNRIRVTSSGLAKSCLFDATEYDLKPYLKSGNRLQLKEFLQGIVLKKPGKHLLSDHDSGHEPFEMSKVGG